MKSGHEAKVHSNEEYVRARSDIDINGFVLCSSSISGICKLWSRLVVCLNACISTTGIIPTYDACRLAMDMILLYLFNTPYQECHYTTYMYKYGMYMHLFNNNISVPLCKRTIILKVWSQALVGIFLQFIHITNVLLSMKSLHKNQIPFLFVSVSFNVYSEGITYRHLGLFQSFFYFAGIFGRRVKFPFLQLLEKWMKKKLPQLFQTRFFHQHCNRNTVISICR